MFDSAFADFVTGLLATGKTNDDCIGRIPGTKVLSDNTFPFVPETQTYYCVCAQSIISSSDAFFSGLVLGAVLAVPSWAVTTSKTLSAMI